MARLKRLLPLCIALAALAAPGTGMADPWKDESGKGRERRERGWDRRGEHWSDRRDRDRWERHDRRGAHRGDRRDDRRGYFPPPYGPPPIPSGHLPPPGEHRFWLPDGPPGHQPPPHRS